MTTFLLNECFIYSISHSGVGLSRGIEMIVETFWWADKVSAFTTLLQNVLLANFGVPHNLHALP